MAKNGAPPIAVSAIRYLVFEGGGAKGIAYVGALQAYFDVRYGKGLTSGRFRWDLDGVAGSSVGAMTALMVALDYTPAEMGNLIVRDGLFASVFSERVKKGHFCAAASAMPGEKPSPLAGYYGADTKNPRDLARNLRAHCCPPSTSPTGAKAPKGGKLPDLEGLEGVFGLLTGLSFLDALPEVGLDYLVAAAKAYVQTTGQLDKTSPEEFWDLFSENLLRRVIADLPAAFAEAALEFDRLGLASNLLSVIGEEMASLVAENPDAEQRKLMILSYPAVLVILYVLVTYGPQWLPDSTDFEKGKTKPKTGRNDRLYYVRMLLMVLWAQQSVEGVVTELVRITLGSPGFRNALRRGLGLDNAPPEQRKDAWQTLNRYCLKLIGKFFAGFGDLLKVVREDGGLWHGDAMRDVLAFIIFNKVVVVGKPGFSSPDEVTFGLRERSIVDRLRAGESLGSIDLLDLIRLDAERARKEGTPAGEGKGAPPPPPPEPPVPIDRAGHEVEEKLATLEKLIRGLQLPGALEAAVAAGKAHALPADEQIRAIRDWFDFAELRRLTRKDLVVTATNITAGLPVYFRESLTPDFPVIEAVRISGGFPILWKPTAVAYTPAGDPATSGRRRDTGERERFYRANYCGYFVDGGFLNNHPMDAFNGIAAPSAGADAPPGSALFNTPQEMLGAPFGGNVLGFHLTNEVEQPCPFDGSFKQTKATRGLSAVAAGLSGTFFASASTLRFLDPRIAWMTLPIRYGQMDLLDLKPDYFAALAVQGDNYERVYERLAGSLVRKGPEALDEMYGVFALRGLGGREARKNQRLWKKALKERKRLLKVPAYRPRRLVLR